MDKEEKPKLTDKQKLFCHEYMVDLNATQAAIRAGYSPNTASVIGSENLSKPNIQEYIANLKNKKLEKVDISAERVLQELGKLAFYNVKQLYDDDGRPLSITDLDDNTAAAICGIDICTQGNQEIGYAEVTKIKLSDKKGALEQLGRYHKLFTDKIDVGGQQDNPLTISIKDEELIKRELERLGEKKNGDA